MNLLATPSRGSAREWFRRGRQSALLGFGLLIATTLSVYGYRQYLRSVQSQLEARVVAAESRMRGLKDLAALVERAEARRTDLVERQRIIERLQALKGAPAGLLETLSRSIPEGLWFVEMKQTGVAVEIDGRAMSLAAIAGFVENLQRSDMFRRPVEITTASTETVEDTTVVRFAIRTVILPPPAAR